ncbi:MAG TPA: hypothetical protein VHA09_03855 [Nitrososphaera sp.]|nr:hypothetical protein [Nitrososphaera sp.]
MIEGKKKNKGIILAVVIAGAIIAATVTAAVGYWSPLSALRSQDATQPSVAASADDVPYSKARLPPPMPLVNTQGIQVSSFAQAKNQTGFATAPALPATKVPTGLDLASIRIRTSAADPQSNIISVFYTPRGVTAADNDTFQGVMAKGGLAIIYSHEPSSQTYDRAKWMEAFVNEAPNARHIENINGSPAIVVEGNPPQGLTHQVFIYSGDLQINLVSMTYTSVDLVKIAQSIQG